MGFVSQNRISYIIIVWHMYRIENNIAVCEIGGKTIDAPAELFENLHEGAVYDIIENNAAEEIKKEQSAQKLQNLFNKRKTEISGD